MSASATKGKPTTRPPAVIAAVEAARRVRRVHRSLSRLSALGSPWRIIAVAPREACHACGFDRAMLTHLGHGTLRFAGASYDRDPQVAADFIRLARAARPQLVDCAPEHEAATRQVPVLVRDAQQASGVFRLLVHTSRTASYVVAPIVQHGVTVGLLHADRLGPDAAPLDELDCEVLWLFASGLGWTMESHVAEPRSAGAIVPVAEPIRVSVDAALEELASGGPGPRGAPSLAPLGPLGTLTTREREILGFLADGASNAAIAEALVISEATVKSHVRHILRKLGACNRTEAVCRLHALSGGAPTALGAVLGRIG